MRSLRVSSSCFFQDTRRVTHIYVVKSEKGFVGNTRKINTIYIRFMSKMPIFLKELEKQN
jgi:hypothetical protein